MASIIDVMTEAIQQCDLALRHVSDANSLYNGRATGNDGIIFSQIHYEMIIEKSFMRMFKTLESYMERVFICYMLGEPGANGNLVDRYVFPVNEEHAQKMLSGKDKYMDFTSRSAIQNCAENFFLNGTPFTYLTGVTQDFEDMKKIRNKISHVSIKSNQDFESVVRSRTTYIPSNTTVASFLMSFLPNTSKTFFTHYIETTKGIISSLANP